jgi:hypothetical protein
MALQPCAECGVQISDKAIACPQCGAAPEKPKKTRWWMLISLALVASFIAWAVILGSSPEAIVRADARESIAICWKEQERKSFDKGTAQFVAGACEKLEARFREKYGRNP